MDANELLAKLTREEKVDVAETFLGNFLRGGFGAMTKREIELLIFHCLERTESFSKLAFYDRANALRIVEGKVKSLKAEATQRYAQLDHRSAITELAIGVARHKTIPASYEGGRIVLVIENPALRRELEHAMRKASGRMDYTLNADVVSVDLASFLQLLRRTIAVGDEELAKRLASGIPDQKSGKKLLASELPLIDRVQGFLDENKDAVGAVSGLLKGLATGGAA